MNIATLPAKPFVAALKGVALAAEKPSGIRDNLKCLHISANGKLVLTASDGCRIHRAEIPVKCGWEGTMLPVAKDLLAALPKAPRKNTAVSLDEDEGMLLVNQVPVYTCDLAYPESVVNTYLDARHSIEVNLHAPSLLDIARCHAPFVKDASNITRLTLTCHGSTGTLTVFSNSAEYGDIRSVMPIDPIAWDMGKATYETAINNQYLRDALSDESGPITLKIASSPRACGIPMTFAGATMTRVVMPMFITPR